MGDKLDCVVPTLHGICTEIRNASNYNPKSERFVPMDSVTVNQNVSTGIQLVEAKSQQLAREAIDAPADAHVTYHRPGRYGSTVWAVNVTANEGHGG